MIEKNIRPGQYVKEGDALYTIADLNRVWLVLEVYESELSWVRVGQSVEVTLESEPHQPLTGNRGLCRAGADERLADGPRARDRREPDAQTQAGDVRAGPDTSSDPAGWPAGADGAGRQIRMSDAPVRGL